MKNTISLIAIGLFLFSCGDEQNTDSVKSELLALDIKAGESLFKSNCSSCHTPAGNPDSRLAPPVFAIKKHYLNEETTDAAFIADLTSFLNNPSEETSKMPGAIKKFGLMPKMGFSEDDLKKIGKFIYHTDFSKPEWFDKHYQENHGEEITEKTPLQLGQELAMNTKKVLGKNLMGAINSKGTAEALSFCNTKAIHLTDSMAIELNAKIKRVSDKNRNPNNKANEQELAYIESAKAQLEAGEEITPQLTEIDNKLVGYYPITTNQMCLQCHGELNTDVKTETLQKIKELYPADKATGYSTNQLRGIWVVEMDK